MDLLWYTVLVLPPSRLYNINTNFNICNTNIPWCSRTSSIVVYTFQVKIIVDTCCMAESEAQFLSSGMSQKLPQPPGLTPLSNIFWADWQQEEGAAGRWSQAGEEEPVCWGWLTWHQAQQEEISGSHGDSWPQVRRAKIYCCPTLTKGSKWQIT